MSDRSTIEYSGAEGAVKAWNRDSLSCISMTRKIVVIDYGAGNLRSVARAVMHVGGEPTVTADPHEVGRSDGGIPCVANLLCRIRFRVF